MSANSLLFVDLDGTLVDVFERYHRLHVDLVSEVGGAAAIERSAYLAAKRAGVSEDRIVQPCFDTPGLLKAYLNIRESRIETPQYLAYDRPFPWTVETLNRLREGCGVHLVTARRSRRNLDVQLRDLGLDQLLDSTTTAPNGDKVSAIEAHPSFTARYTTIVGDTELDVATGKRLGIPTIAVTCGLRNEAFLRSIGADSVIANVSELSIATA